MGTERVGVWHVTAIPEPGLALCRYVIESTVDVEDRFRVPPSGTIDRDAVVADLQAWLDVIEHL